jgi:hypothetical protein
MRATIALAMAFVICGVAAGPALADHDDERHHGRGRGHWKHERHDRGWHGPARRHFFYSEPVYVAPPPVVYVPTYPSPGISLIFPLRIR